MFLERVTELLRQRGITKNKLLLDIGLNQTSFHNWAQRGTVPGGDTLEKLADYFGVTTDYLLGRTDDPGPAAGSGDNTAPSPEDWARAFSELSTDKLMEVQEIMLKEFGSRIKGEPSDQ